MQVPRRRRADPRSVAILGALERQVFAGSSHQRLPRLQRRSIAGLGDGDLTIAIDVLGETLAKGMIAELLDFTLVRPETGMPIHRVATDLEATAHSVREAVRPDASPFVSSRGRALPRTAAAG